MKIIQQVENILKVSHAARNSDRELLIIYMQKSGMELTQKQIELFRNMPSMETIRRSRQALQEQGKYPATAEVEEARYKKYQEMRGAAGLTDPETVLESMGYKVKEWGA